MSNDYTRDPKPRRGRNWRPDGIFTYYGADGRVLFHVHRRLAYRGSINQPELDPRTGKQLKDIFQHWPGTPDGKKPKKNAPIIPYRLPELLTAVRARRRVFVAEGEPKVELLRKWGLVATCNAEGAEKWRRGHAQYLRGAHVVILPDNDDVGRKHANQVGQSLAGVAADCRLLELPGLPAHGDIIDWARAGHTRSQLEQLVEAAPAWAPLQEITEQIETVDGGGLTMKPQYWLWPGRIPCGTLTLLVGQPSVGKSFLYLTICARLTRGLGLPPVAEGVQVREPCGVLIVCTEDRLEHILLPRLVAAGADRHRLRFYRCVRSEEGEARSLDLANDVGAIARLLVEFPDIELIVFDPISEFLGSKIDSHNNTAVRAALSRLMALLDQSGIAALGISHLPKQKSGAMQTAAIGSIGFSATARSSLLVVDEEEDELGNDGEPTGERILTGRKLLATNKYNWVSAEDSKTLAFRIEGCTLSPESDDGKPHEIKTARVVWAGEHAATALELWADSQKRKGGDERHKAKRFIRQMLQDPKQPGRYCSRPATEIHAEAKKADIAERTLERAKQELRVVSKQNGSAYWWEPPPEWNEPAHAY
jgi:putative DNA primase/helicase